MAADAGIAEQTATYGAVVADFDGDGVDDLFIGRHGRPGRLVLDRDGRFVDHEPMVFPGVDRHGCAAADVDGSGLLDLYCAVGGKRGSGLKANELWIDPGGPSPTEVAVERGAADPTGRGRRVVFLEADGEPDVDLVVTNSPVRVDGLPSLGRLLRTKGDGTFANRPRAGFAARLGSLSVQDADYDADGREDLLLVTGGLQAPHREGTRLYRNTPRGLVEVTRQVGIRAFGEIDAELVDVDRDDRLDLVQLSPTHLRVSQWRNGRFRRVYERRLTDGRAISGGDVNGDGKDDLYIVRADGDHNIPDVLLVNRDAGGAWSSLAMPQAQTGRGDEAVAIDHDGNGLEDFVVLNGNNARGPIQLIAFFERPVPAIGLPSPAPSGGPASSAVRPRRMVRPRRRALEHRPARRRLARQHRAAQAGQAGPSGGGQAAQAGPSGVASSRLTGFGHIRVPRGHSVFIRPARGARGVVHSSRPNPGRAVMPPGE